MLIKFCLLVSLCCIGLIAPVTASDQMEDSPKSYGDSLITFNRVKERSLRYMLGGSGDGYYSQAAIRDNDEWMEEVLDKDYEPLVWDESMALKMNVRLNSLASDLRRMATIFQSKRSNYENSPVVRKRIENGLENILEYFAPGSPRPGNWYQWLISLPDNLGAIGLLMESSLPDKLLDRLKTSLRYQLTNEMILTGTNAAWEGRNHMYLALLEGDIDRLHRAAEYVFRTVRYGIKQGVREDYCYLFHGQLPYTGGYGIGFVQTITEFIYVFEDTPFAISSNHFDIVANLLLEHTRWFLVDGQVDLLVRGRAYKRRGSWSRVLEALLVLAQIEGDRQDEFTNTALAMLTSGPGVDLNLTCAGFADQLAAEEAHLPMGFRYWPSGEIGVYNQPSYHIGFRQYSSRVQDYEYLNREDGGQGEEGWNLAYGFTNIVRQDGMGSWYEKDGMMRPAIDMEQLPGATSRIGGNPVNPVFQKDSTKLTMSTTGFSLNFGTSAFAGGAGWKGGGVAGFILEPVYGEFKAQKSLHFFPQGFWSLGSGITSTTRSSDMATKPIHTTLYQWACQDNEPVLISGNDKISLAEGAEISLKEVHWLWLKDEDLGVVFVTPTDVFVRLQDKIVTLWLDHGNQPLDEQYAYALLPHSSLEETKGFAKDPPFIPVRYDKTVHAVKDKGGQNESLVFFKPDSALGIHASSPAIVYHVKNKNGGILTFQDPLHTKETIKFSVKGIDGHLTKADGQIDVSHAGSGNTDIYISTVQGRIYRLGYGSYGEIVYPQPRYDLDEASYEGFHVSAVSDSAKTILTVHLPQEAFHEEYHLSVHFSKGHRLYDFSEADVLDRSSANVVRYMWDRRPAHGPAVFSDYLEQTHGHFRLYLVTQSIQAVDSFEVPDFGKDASTE